MVEVTLLIPVAGNSGLPFSPFHIGIFEDKLLEYFGGYTRRPGHAVGGWVDKGTKYSDILFEYTVAIDGLVKGGGGLREVVDFARAHFQQEAIFLRYLGVAEVL